MKRATLFGLASLLLTACEEATRPVRIDSPIAPPEFSQVLEINLTDLGTLGGASSEAFDINNLGQVVGRSTTAAGEFEFHAFLWEGGTMRDLGTLGGAFSDARGINDLGQVVGVSTSAAGEFRLHAFLWEAGTMTDLGTLGGDISEALDINNLGQVVGVSTTAGGDQRAFVWEAGTMADLGTLGGDFSHARAINDLGQVVGVSRTAGGDERAFLWEAWTMTDLGTLTGPFEELCSVRRFPLESTVANGISNLGRVAGGTMTHRDLGRAFLWEAGAITDLGTLGGDFSEAFGTNNLGQVVGVSRTAACDFRAFLWQAGAMTDLGTLGGEFSEARAINDLGQVVGLSTTPSGEGHATLWTVQLRPATPEEETEILTTDVDGLVSSGALNGGQGNALLATLDAITRQLNQGNSVAAARLFQAFSRMVEGYVSAGILLREDAQPLIDAAQNAIDQLSGIA